MAYGVAAFDVGGGLPFGEDFGIAAETVGHGCVEGFEEGAAFAVFGVSRDTASLRLDAVVGVELIRMIRGAFHFLTPSRPFATFAALR
jgi:hypothetical protein